MLKRVIACMALAFSLTAQAATTPVAKISAMLDKPKALCGRFEQSKQLTGIKKPLLSTGRFCVVAGKGVLWRNLKPFANTLRLSADEIVQYQGERVALRLEAKREPTVRIINSVLFSLLAGDLAQLDKLFEVEANVQEQSWQVKLKAKDAALAKAIGSIALDGAAYVKNIQMLDASGDKTDIQFFDIKTGESAMLAEEAALF